MGVCSACGCVCVSLPSVVKNGRHSHYQSACYTRFFSSAQWPPQGQSPYVQTNTTLISLRIKIWTEMKEIIIRNNQSVRRVRMQQGWQCVYVCVQSSALCLPFISICPFIPHPLISFPDILRQDNNKRDRRNKRAW